MINFGIFSTVIFTILACSSDSSFNSFTIKQCEISDNCINNGNSILIAIDGTGQREAFEEELEFRKYASSIGINNNHEWIWKSHVANFWEEYQGDSYYFYGPDSTGLIPAGNEVKSIVDKGHSKICEFIQTKLKNITVNKLFSMTESGELGIDITGFSRGGFAAMELSRVLQFSGCNNIKPIPVRWMGLYDPVQRDMDFEDLTEDYDNEQIAENVMNVAIVERSRFIHSRLYFGYGVKGNDENKKEVNASHAGVGGTPTHTDCEENPEFMDIEARLCSDQYTLDLDKNGALETEQWMREHAVLSNVPIPHYDNYNDYFGDFTDFKE